MTQKAHDSTARRALPGVGEAPDERALPGPGVPGAAHLPPPAPAAPDEGCLIAILSPPETGRAFELLRTPVSLGRSPASDVVLRHASLPSAGCLLSARDDGGWTILDVASERSITVGKVRCNEAVLPRTGVFRVGHVGLLVGPLCERDELLRFGARLVGEPLELSLAPVAAPEEAPVLRAAPAALLRSEAAPAPAPAPGQAGRPPPGPAPIRSIPPMGPIPGGGPLFRTAALPPPLPAVSPKPEAASLPVARAVPPPLPVAHAVPSPLPAVLPRAAPSLAAPASLGAAAARTSSARRTAAAVLAIVVAVAGGAALLRLLAAPPAVPAASPAVAADVSPQAGEPGARTAPARSVDALVEDPGAGRAPPTEPLAAPALPAPESAGGDHEEWRFPAWFVPDGVVAWADAPLAVEGALPRLARCSGAVVLTGHADGHGDELYNERLGLARALAVETLLAQHGFRSARVRLETAGSRRPAARNASEDGRRANRRVSVQCQ